MDDYVHFRRGKFTVPSPSFLALGGKEEEPLDNHILVETGKAA
jgi:hypothetical protein